MSRDPTYAILKRRVQERTAASQTHDRVARFAAMKWRVALWLGAHLPFEWAPRWANNRLASWMWRQYQHQEGFPNG